MVYSSFGILAVILHLIINYDILKNGSQSSPDSPHYRYRQFLNALLLFYVADLIWGFLADLGIRILLYADTMIYFAAMALSLLLWTRYVVAFLNKSGARSKAFLAAGWGIFLFGIVHIIVNLFYPVIFYIAEDSAYEPLYARYFILAAQLILFILISIYSLFVSIRSEGKDKVHYKAVCVSGAVMATFITLQTLDEFAPYYTIGCLIANCLLHVFVEEDEKREQDRLAAAALKEKEKYSQIASSLAMDYEAIYYININTGKYIEISTSNEYRSMDVPFAGNDFYSETRANALLFAHPDDREFAESMYYKETMMANLEGRNSYSYKYRIMIKNEPRYYRFDVVLSEDKQHMIVCDKDIQDTITVETALRENRKASVTFGQIAESLASNYDAIYYIDTDTSEYVGFTSKNIYGELEVNDSGEDFFLDSKNSITAIAHPHDKDRMISVLDKDHLISALDDAKQIEVTYRIYVNGNVQHTRLTARRTSDGKHIIIVVENIENEVRKENEHLRALNTEKELARRDELTGTRNKTAFTELEESIQENIDNGMTYIPFAVAVCDLNDLKKINDSNGHKAGDDYIKESAKLLCTIFDHSPVFRIGGDEFAIFLTGDDYSERKELTAKVEKTTLANIAKCNGPVIAIGMADYDINDDSRFSDTFERADQLMYENKRKLKSL